MAAVTDRAPLLSAQAVYKQYRMGGQDVPVLRGVNLFIGRGEWVAVLGASGSGKSTLLHLLGGLDRPTQGKIRFNDADVVSHRAKTSDRYRSQVVGFVFQFYHLLPELTVMENVLIAAMVGRSTIGWLVNRSEVRHRAKELLSRLGLGERLWHRPAELSGGERQRVAIARSMINQPEVLLADEPTGNLDAETGGEILDVFRELHGQGQTIVMVTHDMGVAAAADRRVELSDGCLGATGA